MQILECKVDPFQEESVEVMVIPVRSGGLRGGRDKATFTRATSPLCVYCPEMRQ